MESMMREEGAVRDYIQLAHRIKPRADCKSPKYFTEVLRNSSSGDLASKSFGSMIPRLQRKQGLKEEIKKKGTGCK